MLEEGRSLRRKPRSDRKHRFTYRTTKERWDNLDALGFNHNLSCNKVIDVLLDAAMHNDQIMAAFRLAYPLRKQYVLVREEE